MNIDKLHKKKKLNFRPQKSEKMSCEILEGLIIETGYQQNLNGDSLPSAVILAPNQIAACQVILASHCPGGNKRVAEAVGQKESEVEELQEREAEEEAKRTEGEGEISLFVHQN